MDSKISRVVKIVTAHFNTSVFEDIPEGKMIDGPMIIKECKKLMDRKLDKNDFEEEMQTKSSLRDTEMVLHSLSVFYW